MKPTRSARDTPASGQDGTSSHDNVPNVNQPTNVVSKSVPDSKVGTAHDSIQEVSQDAPPQRIPDISRKIARAKWRRYSPGFKVRAVRLTRANAEDGTRVGLRRAALVLGIRHDAIVVWQRHFDELRQQAIDNDEDVNEDLSDLIYKVGFSGVGGKRNIPKAKEDLLAQLVIERQSFTVDGIVTIAREVWPSFMPNPSPSSPSKSHALWYNRVSTWVSRFTFRHNINRHDAFGASPLADSVHIPEPDSAGSVPSSQSAVANGYHDVPTVNTTAFSSATVS